MGVLEAQRDRHGLDGGGPAMMGGSKALLDFGFVYSTRRRHVTWTCSRSDNPETRLLTLVTSCALDDGWIEFHA